MADNYRNFIKEIYKATDRILEGGTVNPVMNCDPAFFKKEQTLINALIAAVAESNPLTPEEVADNPRMLLAMLYKGDAYVNGTEITEFDRMFTSLERKNGLSFAVAEYKRFMQNPLPLRRTLMVSVVSRLSTLNAR